MKSHQYNAKIAELFFNTSHAGVLNCQQPLTVCYYCNTQHHNTYLELYLRCNLNKQIIQTKFKTFGNPYLIAGLEWLCQNLENTSINRHPWITAAIISDTLQIPKIEYTIALFIETSYNKIILLSHDLY